LHKNGGTAEKVDDDVDLHYLIISFDMLFIYSFIIYMYSGYKWLVMIINYTGASILKKKKQQQQHGTLIFNV